MMARTGIWQPALTGQPLGDRDLLRRYLRCDPDGQRHRAIVMWLGLPAAARPPALRRLPRGQPTPQTTRSLLRVLGMTLRANRLFGDLARTRSWLATATPESDGSWAYPLTHLNRPAHRRRLIDAIRRTEHGLY